MGNITYTWVGAPVTLKLKWNKKYFKVKTCLNTIRENSILPNSQFAWGGQRIFEAQPHSVAHSSLPKRPENPEKFLKLRYFIAILMDNNIYEP